MPGISVLVVDDHVVFADALQARLAREPDLEQVAVAYHVREATHLLATMRPDVAILDVVLGKASGVDLVRQARRISPESRVLMLTGADTTGDVTLAVSNGARAWLPKTVNLEHLLRVIRGVARGEAWLAPDLLGHVLSDITRRAPAGADPLAALTERELEVLQCMVDGLIRAQIAERLRVSENTVRTHTQHLIGKLGVHSALESVALALRHGLRASDS